MENDRGRISVIRVALFVTLLVSGCSLFSPKPPDVVIRENPVPVVCSSIDQKPDGLELQDTPPTLVMDETETWGYWFPSELYAALAENLQAMRRYMRQLRGINSSLVDCIESHNDGIAPPA